ncbi:unnamed protein product [Zymoseptoria tritici ST99CH_3D7]|uniref:non-specific serine/threonine protein kinase n=1 Tax=Zymoseptoria tritici (strain ST99CH_3D7) TaxID=1276538 RepID=A0A1X7S6W7_ZYMT9|nr:unnamed protein product [Zymoseptoria tritici ST99CH_3D7]
MSTAHGQIHCEIEGEELHRYKPGGYHPVHLGDKLDDGRFTVLHKLGWGGYGTTWLALDESCTRNVALKVNIAELSPDSKEIEIYQKLSAGSDQHEGKDHIAQLLHSFSVHGPNGKHGCLVTELLGLSAAAAADRQSDGRLPGRLSWQAVRQTIKALAYMHEEGIVHGDLHPGNILLPCDDRLKRPGTEALQALDSVRREDIHAISYTASLPKYMVRPISLPLKPVLSKPCTFKVIDFGSSFESGLEPAPKMRCPLPFRAPEAVLTRQWDKQADIWSLGCTIFSLVAGQPPFDSIFSDERSLVADWIASFGPLPQEWDNVVMSFKDIEPTELDTPDLVEWLRELYFDEDRKPFFVEEDIEKIGDLILSLLKRLRLMSAIHIRSEYFAMAQHPGISRQACALVHVKNWSEAQAVLAQPERHRTLMTGVFRPSIMDTELMLKIAAAGTALSSSISTSPGHNAWRPKRQKARALREAEVELRFQHFIEQVLVESVDGHVNLTVQGVNRIIAYLRQRAVPKLDMEPFEEDLMDEEDCLMM